MRIEKSKMDKKDTKLRGQGYLCPNCYKYTRVLYFIEPDKVGKKFYNFQLCHVCLYRKMKN